MFKDLFFHFGNFILWQGQIYKKPENHMMYYKETIRQMYDIGVGSLPIVFLISIFIGAVTSVQFYYQMAGTLIPAYYIGYIVRDMTIIELAPTITCLVLAGKVGSNMAAELGGMRQKEHIDAMEIMGVNTSAYLILPKIIASVLMVPVLVCAAAMICIMGAYLSSVPTGLFTSAEFIKGVRSFFVPYNVFMMMVKAVVFGYILTNVSCYQGYFVKGGSIELGEASTRAVVYSNILILLADYVIAIVLTA
ncbi:MAG: ABC transporter permease [Saprospiraceae bacterium]|jgi:phospholipid/cholesterol/gamma-HCH transport system permease protein|nr:ABC transporter permease [Saprospiraceae bacterium]